MEFRRLTLPDVVEILPRKFGDERGFFSEVYKQPMMDAQGLPINWMQDNQSFSAPVGTVRGLHYQAPPYAQDKLVRVLRGAIYDVAVDIRLGSPTYGQWVGVTLSAEKWNQLMIPAGFAHGFMTIEPDTEVLYKVNAPYAPKHEGAILWNDPEIGIAWPALDESPTLSTKDASAPRFREHQPVFRYEAQT
tara:strand:+ start:391 stop:960 length:570 start_codon:yes stop_codon:yes gene_type:complete